MSLDVCLTLDEPQPIRAGSGIYIRDNGATVEISREEWNRRFPGRAPVIALTEDDEYVGSSVYSANITHNLNRMADEAGIYKHLWRPDEIGITKAEQLIVPLRDGLALLQTEPERFDALNPENGWGDYDGLVSFVARYLAACERWPQATVGVSR